MSTYVHSIHIKAPRARVWAELTRTGSVLTWYFESVLEAELEAGSRFRYRSEDGRRTWIVGEILEVVDGKKLVHSFDFEGMGDAPSKVTFELADENGGTRLTVRHDDLAPKSKTQRAVTGGWPFILGNLAAVLERGRMPLGAQLKWAVMKRVMPLMQRA